MRNLIINATYRVGGSLDLLQYDGEDISDVTADTIITIILVLAVKAIIKLSK